MYFKPSLLSEEKGLRAHSAVCVDVCAQACVFVLLFILELGKQFSKKYMKSDPDYNRH